MKLSLLFLSCGFFLGFYMRPKPFESAASAPVEDSRSSVVSKSGEKAARAPQSASVASSNKVAPEVDQPSSPKIDIAQAMQSNDMARMYDAFLHYQHDWLTRFIYSHAHFVYKADMGAVEAKLIRELPVQKDGDEKYFRGKTTLKIGGHSIYIDAIFQPTLDTHRNYRDEESVHPCLRMDGYMVVDDQIIQRLDFDQMKVCARNIYERNGFVFVGVENYRDKTGIYLNMLLFPANPMDHLPLEYLGPKTSEWQKDEQWTWAPAVAKDQEVLWSEMTEKAEELGVDPQLLWGVVFD